MKNETNLFVYFDNDMTEGPQQGNVTGSAIFLNLTSFF